MEKQEFINWYETPFYILKHHFGNYITLVQAANLRAKNNKRDYRGAKLMEDAKRHVEGIRSVYDKIDPEKAGLIEEFCTYLLQVPIEADEQYLETLLQEYKKITPLIESL